MNESKHSSDASEFIGTESAAALLGCSYQTIRRMVDAGKLPRPIKVGRLNRWLKSSILAALI